MAFKINVFIYVLTSGRGGSLLLCWAGGAALSRGAGGSCCRSGPWTQRFLPGPLATTDFSRLCSSAFSRRPAVSSLTRGCSLFHCLSDSAGPLGGAGQGLRPTCCAGPLGPQGRCWSGTTQGNCVLPEGQGLRPTCCAGPLGPQGRCWSRTAQGNRVLPAGQGLRPTCCAGPLGPQGRCWSGNAQGNRVLPAGQGCRSFPFSSARPVDCLLGHVQGTGAPACLEGLSCSSKVRTI